MNIQEYIESGILDAYALGALTPEEEVLVEANIAQFPDLADEMLAIEEAMYLYSKTLAKEPPAMLEHKIMGAINTTAAQSHITVAAHTQPRESRQIPLPPPTQQPRMQWKYAALWIGLAVSMGINGYMMMGNKQKAEQQTVLSGRMQQIESEQAKMAALVADYRKNKDMMSDTGMQTIVMRTMQKGHPMAATIYWNKANGTAYVSVDGLPAPPKGMQYQLWTIQGGAPVDMGILPLDMASTPAMQKVNKQVMACEAFAISLEKEGGSPSPTMQNIYVMGKPSA